MTEQRPPKGPSRALDERRLAIEERKLLLDERKFEADIELRKHELAIKGQESGWPSRFFTPLTTTLLAGVLTLAGSVVGTLLQGRQTLELEERKFGATRDLEQEKFGFSKAIETNKQQHELIVKMISVGDEKQARANIRFLAETGLISDADLAKRLLASPWVGVLPATSTVVPGSRLHVLTVGISEYGAPELHLDYADRDASDLADALYKTQEDSLYTDVKITFLKNEAATRAAIYQSLEAIARITNDQDTVVISFSGSGSAIDDTFYLYPYDVSTASSSETKASAISPRELRSQIAGFRSRRVLLLVDGCAGDCDLLRSEIASGGISVLTATQGREFSREDPKWQHGAFTKVLLDALTGRADLDHNGILSLTELVSYMAKALPDLTDGRQHLGVVQTFEGQIFRVVK
jgi:Caspase domain